MKRGLPLELFLGLRYLTARGSRANLSLFVWIGVGGVFLGVAALIVVLAVMTGFQDGIRDRIISANPHLLVFQSGSGGLADAAGVVARVTTVPGVRAATPFVLQQALFTSAGGDAHGGLVRGVDFDSRVVRDDLKAQLRAGRLEAAAGGTRLRGAGRCHRRRGASGRSLRRQARWPRGGRAARLSVLGA